MTCPRCKGAGRVVDAGPEGARAVVACLRCAGTGKVGPR
jgi:DnaJ-class molecular chaperone